MNPNRSRTHRSVCLPLATLTLSLPTAVAQAQVLLRQPRTGVRSVGLTAIFAITSLALLGARPASAQLTLQSGVGPATLSLNNFGPSKSQVVSGYQSVYGGGASSGFVFQTGATSAAVNILVVYNANGSSGLYLDARAPVYDGVEDSTVGILNLSTSAINKVVLNAPGSGLAEFDGDGADAASAGGNGMTNIIPPTPNPTGYEGPTSTFTLTPNNPNTLTINFLTPIAAGGSSFFFVENYPQPIVGGIGGTGGGTAVGVTPPVPEPGSLALLAAGGLSGAGWMARRRRKRARSHAVCAAR